MTSSLRSSASRWLAPLLLTVLSTPGLALQARGDFGASFSRAPLAFVENQGQWPSELRFRLGRGAHGAAVLMDGFALSLVGRAPSANVSGRGSALRFRFESESPALGPRGRTERPGLYNFLIGSDPEQWRTGVRAWERVRFDSVWPGVDVVLREGAGLFEYDLEVAPGADWTRAVMVVSGARSLAIDEQGRLAIETEVGVLHHSAPVAWTTDDAGGTHAHPCEFRLLGGDRFGFVVPPVAPDRGLVVDPGLLWSAFLGDLDQDAARALAVAPNGDVVATGSTWSADFPRTVGAYDLSWNGAFDLFVSRVAADGSALVYSTFLGGSGSESGNGVALHSDGSIFVVGDTDSPNFPTTASVHDSTFNGSLDGFVAHLDSTGAVLLGSTYLGSPGFERLIGLALDDHGRPVVCGSTGSSAFPVVAGSFDTVFGGGGADAFVSRLSNDLSTLEFSTFLGGNGNERADCVAVDGAGRISVAGWTHSTNFPTSPGAFDGSLNGTGTTQDGFVARLEANGQSLTWSTYLGGAQADAVSGLTLIPNGDCVVVGTTESADFPMAGVPAQSVHGGGEDAFVTRLAKDGTQLVHSTFFGGAGADRAAAVTTLAGDGVAVIGTTGSTDLNLEPWVWDTHFGYHSSAGTTDAVVLRYEKDGRLSYASYLGGGEEEAGMDIASDGLGGVFLCGETNSYNYPITPGAFDISYDFSTVPDGFVTHFQFVRYPFTYGSHKVNSVGGWASLTDSGFPSLTGNGFTIWADGAISNSQGLFFWSEQPGALPFAGGELLMGPPFHRTPLVQTEWFGSASLDVVIDSSMVGTTRYYQFWYTDPGDAWGVGLSSGLEVRFYP